MAKLIDITGKAISGAWGTDDLVGNGVPVLRTTNFTNIGIVNFNNVVTRQIEKKYISEKLLRYGDIIIEKSGGSDKQPVGRVVFFEGEDNKYLFNNFTSLLRVRDFFKWNPKYIFYSLFANYAKGGTIPFENRTTGLHNLQTDSYVNSVMIMERKFEEQTDIVRILDKINQLINYEKKQLEDLDILVKSRFIEMFGDQTNPLEWPIVEVQEVADIRVGVVIKPAQYYTEEEDGIKAFRSLNIGQMIIKNNNWVYFSEEGNKKNAKSQLQENDLLIVRSGSPGTACVVTKDYEGCNAVDIIIARPLLSAVNPYYLCAYTNFPHGKRQIEDGTGGAAQQHFNIGKYNKLKLMLPPIELQNKFEEFYSQVDKSKLAIQQSLDELETLKKSLMQQYFG